MSTGSLDTATPSPPTFPPTNGHNHSMATPTTTVKYGTLVPNRIFVGGISSNTTEADLHKLFSTFGNVKATKIISDRGGCSKGYGFVTFETEEEAKKLQAEADNIILKERKLNIAPAIKKQQPYSTRPYELGQPVINGTVYYHNGIPYTYQNGVAMFTGGTANQNVALEALTSPAAAPLHQPFLFPQHQQMYLPNNAAATAALLSAAHNPGAAQGTSAQPQFFPQTPQQQVAAALQQQAASPLGQASSIATPVTTNTPTWQQQHRWMTNGASGTNSASVPPANTPTPGTNGQQHPPPINIPQSNYGTFDNQQSVGKSWYGMNNNNNTKNKNNYNRRGNSGDRKFFQGHVKHSQDGICHVCPANSPSRFKPHFSYGKGNAKNNGNLGHQQSQQQQQPNVNPATTRTGLSQTDETNSCAKNV